MLRKAVNIAIGDSAVGSVSTLPACVAIASCALRALISSSLFPLYPGLDPVPSVRASLNALRRSLPIGSVVFGLRSHLAHLWKSNGCLGHLSALDFGFP